MTTMKVQIELPAPHTQGQHDVILSTTNDVLLAGRRWGKTEAGVERIFIRSFEQVGLYWWVGLSWRSASMKRAWRRIKQIARAMYHAIGVDPTPYIREVDKEVKLPNGSEIWLRSAERPESLAGEGLLGVVLDEFTLMKEIVWVEYIEATLLDYGGWALFMGVPKGNNWGATLYRSAAGRDGWQQFNFTTYQNPFIDTKRIDEIKANTPERWFNQEYMAQIIDDAGGVFRRVVDNATASEQDVRMATYYNDENEFVKIDAYDPEGNGHYEQIPHEYIFGVDWGQQNDFTVISVIDLTQRHLVHVERFNKIDYIFQSERLKALNRRFNPTVIIAEANSMGGPVIERLLNEGLPMRPFTTTNITKEEIVRNLSAAFENDEIKIIPDNIVIGELQSYEQQQRSGKWFFSAPDGMHDDCVMSLAIAWHGVASSRILLFEV